MATSQDFCLCGRNAAIVHCPRCGYATVRAVPSKNFDAVRPDGSTVTLRVYVCRKCSTYFNDDDWQLRCQAPPPRGLAKREEMRHKKPEEVLTPEAIRAAQEAQAKQRYDTSMPEEDRIAALNRMIQSIRRNS
jgi:DNA-directed RNA polymerase subunit RPC12/RpoP